MSKRAEEAAKEIYKDGIELFGRRDKGGNLVVHPEIMVGILRNAAARGYEQAGSDLAPAFEFSFDVPDNDGHIVFTPMDNMTIRKELKLKTGERVIVSIRKEHEKE